MFWVKILHLCDLLWMNQCSCEYDVIRILVTFAFKKKSFAQYWRQYTQKLIPEKPRTQVSIQPRFCSIMEQIKVSLTLFANSSAFHAATKASELVPGSLFPRLNSIRVFEGITIRHKLTELSKFRDPVPAKFKYVTNIETCTLLCCD